MKLADFQSSGVWCNNDDESMIITRKVARESIIELQFSEKIYSTEYDILKILYVCFCADDDEFRREDLFFIGNPDRFSVLHEKIGDPLLYAKLWILNKEWIYKRKLFDFYENPSITNCREWSILIAVLDRYATAIDYNSSNRESDHARREKWNPLITFLKTYDNIETLLILQLSAVMLEYSDMIQQHDIIWVPDFIQQWVKGVGYCSTEFVPLILKIERMKRLDQPREEYLKDNDRKQHHSEILSVFRDRYLLPVLFEWKQNNVSNSLN